MMHVTFTSVSIFLCWWRWSGGGGGGGGDHLCSTVGYRKGIGGLTQKNLHTADCSGLGTKVRADQCVPASLVIFESTIRFENQLF